MAGGVGSISASLPVMVVEDARSGARSFHFLMEGFGRTLVLGMWDEEVGARLAWFRDELGPALDASYSGARAASTCCRSWPRRCGAATSCTTATRRRRRCWPSSSREDSPAPESRPSSRSAPSSSWRPTRSSSCPCSLAVSRLALDGGRGHRRLEPRHGLRRERPRVRHPGRGVAGPLVHGPGRGADRSPPSRVHGAGRRARLRRLAAGRVLRARGVGAPGRAGALAGARRRRASRTPDSRRCAADRARRASGAARPVLGDGGAPVGVDARGVVETGIRPVIDIVMVHPERGRGMVGFGLTSPPLACFEQAVEALANAG